MTAIEELEARAAAGAPMGRADVEALVACPDLPRIGALGERARKARHGGRVTFVRVCEVSVAPAPSRAEAGEVRIVARPPSFDEAAALVREAKRIAGAVPVTGFSLADLVQLAGGDHLALAEAARALSRAGLEAVADVPLDALGETDAIVEAIRAVTHAGLRAWRATIHRGALPDRLPLAERAEAVQRETLAFKAFAPLPQDDPRDQPATGYDDVRTITLARLVCGSIPSIQVDWRQYGPKLAQVAIAYGADDLDRISPETGLDAGRRRAPREEIVRHIRMAFANPVERDGRFTLRP